MCDPYLATISENKSSKYRTQFFFFTASTFPFQISIYILSFNEIYQHSFGGSRQLFFESFVRTTERTGPGWSSLFLFNSIASVRIQNMVSLNTHVYVFVHVTSFRAVANKTHRNS